MQLKASTIRFYDRIIEAVLLFVCYLSVDPDPVDCPVYYAWLRDEQLRIDVVNLPKEQNAFQSSAAGHQRGGLAIRWSQTSAPDPMPRSQ